jgi:hypothetical protein
MLSVTVTALLTAPSQSVTWIARRQPRSGEGCHHEGGGILTELDWPDCPSHFHGEARGTRQCLLLARIRLCGRDLLVAGKSSQDGDDARAVLAE